MLADIIDRDAEVAGAAIDIESACAEGDIGSEIVKIVERDEIHQQTVHIAVKEHEFFKLGNIFTCCSIGEIFGAEIQKTLKNTGVEETGHTLVS